MKTKLLVAVLLCAVIGAGFATGSQEADDASASGLSRATIEFYFAGESKRDTQLVWDEVEDRTADTLNADLEYTFIPWGDYRNRMSVIAAAGDQYEAHFDADWFVFPTLAARDGLLDITELFPENAPNLYAQYTDADLAPATLDGRLLAIPWQMPKADRPNFQVREDLRIKYDLPIPETYEDFELYLETIAANEPDLIPLYPGYSRRESWPRHGFVDGWVSLPSNVGYAYQRDDAAMQLVAIEQTDTYAEMIEMRRRWYESGYVPRDLLQAPNEAWSSGKFASTIHIWGWPDHDVAVKAINPDWSVRTYPIHPEAVGQLASPMNNAVAFGANADEPERALMFLEWLQSSQENFDLLIYGIEGTHYEIEDGDMTYPEGIDPANHSYQGWTSQWGFWNVDYYRYPDFYPDDWAEQLEEYVGANHELDPHLGFSIDQEPIKTELAQRSALWNEMGVALEAGVVDPSQLDSYIEQQRENAEVIREELQRQLDAWRESQ